MDPVISQQIEALQIAHVALIRACRDLPPEVPVILKATSQYAIRLAGLGDAILWSAHESDAIAAHLRAHMRAVRWAWYIVAFSVGVGVGGLTVGVIVAVVSLSPR